MHRSKMSCTHNHDKYNKLYKIFGAFPSTLCRIMNRGLIPIRSKRRMKNSSKITFSSLKYSKKQSSGRCTRLIKFFIGGIFPGLIGGVVCNRTSKLVTFVDAFGTLERCDFVESKFCLHIQLT